MPHTKHLPFVGILVPARNEGYVIENTIRRLSKLNYPKNKYAVFIVVDERELKDPVEVFTRTVVYETAPEMVRLYGSSFIKLIEVPEWYGGEYQSHERTYKRSTKGRALNYALQVLESNPKWDKIEMIGVLDADGRLDVNVLQEVARNRMYKKSKLLQGPVFQISNIDNISLTGVAAGLELAIHHMTELVSKIISNKVQFLAGTNYFVDKQVLEYVGGWDQDSLVEDAELALRIYSQLGQKTEWLNSPELEQSPGTVEVYLKQRERWSRGHIYLIHDIVRSNLSFLDKLKFIKRILLAQGRFIIDISVPTVALVLLVHGDLGSYGVLFKWTSLFFFIASLFIFELYGYTLRKVSKILSVNVTTKEKLILSIKLFCFMPVFMLLQIIPRVKALGNIIFKKKMDWYKTERTKELITE